MTGPQLAIVATGVLAAPCFWLALNLMRRSVRIDSGAALHTRDLLELKGRIASAVESPRLIFFGLSNVMMGVRAEQVGAELGVRTLNFGLIANLSPGVAIDALERILRPGDRVVLALPYWFFHRATALAPQRAIVRDLVFSTPTRAYFDLPLRDRMSMLATQRPSQVLEAVGRGLLERVGHAARWPGPSVLPHLRLAKDGGAFTEVGDWTGNARSERTCEMLERIRSRPVDTAACRFEPGGEAARCLARLVRRGRERGVGFCAIWPVAYVGEAADRSAALRAPILDDLASFYAELGVPTRGTPDAFFYPLDAFFDSANHLTREASELYSAQVAELARGFVDDAAQS